ncbi:MAG: LAGLIDADG family homing endonuclease [Candidatus Colwellbacteria bacterium]|nr:LAGLIDADG family homing endonuclease [Candidatus Colwellbacteria bacterium]
MVLTNDYIRGLVEGEGCFSFCNVPLRPGQSEKSRLPTFALTMNERDKNLVEAVRRQLGGKNQIYELGPYMNDGHNRRAIVRLMVRDIGTLKNTIVPFFYNKLHGYKGKQFKEWIEITGKDTNVPKSYKIMWKLHKSGYYSNNPRFD